MAMALPIICQELLSYIKIMQVSINGPTNPESRPNGPTNPHPESPPLGRIAYDLMYSGEHNCPTLSSRQDLV